ncbi:MAG: class I SAM-dependent methyltransferase [bacterium]|nr:class I SAM-dependent methyltransferase [bacterium]
MEDLKLCYTCNSSNIIQYEIVEGYDILKCNDCNLKWVANELDPEFIKSFYDEKYYNSSTKIGYQDYLKDEKIHRKNAKNILKHIKKYLDSEDKKLLDIGCAHGFFLDEVRKDCKCKVYGTELSSYSFNYAKNILGLNVLQCDIDENVFEEEFFDVILLIGTIEHLTSPKVMLENIHRILKKGGLLVITTIDTNGLLPLYSLKPPEHLFYFSHGNLSLLLDKHGFEKILRKNYFVNYFLHDLFHRLYEFAKINIFKSFSKIIKKKTPEFSILIPTNEMIFIAKKK